MKTLNRLLQGKQEISTLALGTLVTFSGDLFLNGAAVILTTLHMLLIFALYLVKVFTRVIYGVTFVLLLACLFILVYLLIMTVYLAASPALNNNLS